MRSLIIGAAEFVGPWLAKELLQRHHDVHVTKLPSESFSQPNVTVHELDVCNSNTVYTLVRTVCPDELYYLTALSSVTASWEHPQLTVEINVTGTLNVLQAVQKVNPMLQVLLVGSSEEYALSARGNTVLSENTSLPPGNPYAASKASQGMFGSIWARAWDIPVIMVRAFNHIGPDQSDQFVASDFAHQISLIEAGLRDPTIWTGNLDVARDFSGVRDIVSAYADLIQNGEPVQTYNMGSGIATSIRDLLRDLLLFSTVNNICIQQDPTKYRPTDMPATRTDISKLQQVCTWTPGHTLHDSLGELITWWRNSVSSNPTTETSEE